VARETPYETWRETVLSAGGPFLVAAHLFDVYEGPPLPPGYRNLAFSLRFQSEEGSLTDEEVERWLEELRAALRRKGALLRS
jgi:phenylalanyl-tRNA synthetase beta chain